MFHRAKSTFNPLSPQLSAVLFVLAVTVLASCSRVLSADPSADFRTAISRGDLDFTYPATRSEEGMPVGNGRMGSLVWTTPSALKFQINRCDVFGVDSSSVSFPHQDEDYASGCGYVDINVASAGPDVFVSNGFNQHLGIYDGVMTTTGTGLAARVLAWNAHDVIAVEIDEQRTQPEPINIDLACCVHATILQQHELAAHQQSRSPLPHGQSLCRFPTSHSGRSDLTHAAVYGKSVLRFVGGGDCRGGARITRSIFE